MLPFYTMIAIMDQTRNTKRLSSLQLKKKNFRTHEIAFKKCLF